MEKLKWLSSAVFLELLGLSQCLPGPTSTQVSFAIGVVHKGVTGGLMTGDLTAAVEQSHNLLWIFYDFDVVE